MKNPANIRRAITGGVREALAREEDRTINPIALAEYLADMETRLANRFSVEEDLSKRIEHLEAEVARLKQRFEGHAHRESGQPDMHLCTGPPEIGR